MDMTMDMTMDMAMDMAMDMTMDTAMDTAMDMTIWARPWIWSCTKRQERHPSCAHRPRAAAALMPSLNGCHACPYP